MLPEGYKKSILEIYTTYNDIIRGGIGLKESEIKDLKLSLYKLDIALTRMKEFYGMPELDSTLISPENMSNEFLDAKRDDYFRPVDYEYYFLIYSLLEHDDISRQTLSQIIEGFFRYSKVKKRLKYTDIERTRTGAVRCKTNLRFAILHLRELGFINSFEKGKRAWSLTLPGFLVAAHICLKQPFAKFEPYEFNLHSLRRNEYKEYHYMLDDKLFETIQNLCDEKILGGILNYADDLLPDSNLKYYCRNLFKDYSTFLGGIYDIKNERNINKKEFSKELKNFIIKTNNDSKLKLFKSQFSELINTRKFYEEINRILGKESRT